jgi:hypothetical protein
MLHFVAKPIMPLPIRSKTFYERRMNRAQEKIGTDISILYSQLEDAQENATKVGKNAPLLVEQPEKISSG